MELDESVLYRLAYGLAADLAEADQDVLAGRHRNNPAAGGTPGRILAEVLTRLGASADRELVREAVEDAMEKRRPRW
jgi:hypothetical protein